MSDDFTNNNANPQEVSVSLDDLMKAIAEFLYKEGYRVRPIPTEARCGPDYLAVLRSIIPVEDRLPLSQCKLFGLPIVVDETMPKNQVEIRDQYGKTMEVHQFSDPYPDRK